MGQTCRFVLKLKVLQQICHFAHLFSHLNYKYMCVFHGSCVCLSTCVLPIAKAPYAHRVTILIKQHFVTSFHIYPTLIIFIQIFTTVILMITIVPSFNQIILRANGI